MKHKIYLLLLGILFLSPLTVNAQPNFQNKTFVRSATCTNGVRTEENSSETIIVSSASGKIVYKWPGLDMTFVGYYYGQKNGWYLYSQYPTGHQWFYNSMKYYLGENGTIFRICFDPITTPNDYVDYKYLDPNILMNPIQ